MDLDPRFEQAEDGDLSPPICCTMSARMVLVHTTLRAAGSDAEAPAPGNVKPGEQERSDEPGGGGAPANGPAPEGHSRR